MRITFIVNPAAGRGRTRSFLPGFQRTARNLAADVDVQWTQGPGHASTLARAAARVSDALCIFGGDGTVSEVVNGLMPEPVPLAVVPTGSGNDFASLVGCPRTPDELWRVLGDGVGTRLDVVDCGDRFCANSVGIGFEALVTFHSRSIRRLRGLPLYLLAVLKALSSYEATPFVVRFEDGEEIRGDLLMISIGNGVRAGGGFHLTPDAIPDDGLVDVCIADHMSRARLLLLLPSAIAGGHVRKRGVRVRRSPRVTVESPRPFPVHIDGEYLGTRVQPLALSVLTRRLPVLCRREAAPPGASPLERLL